jgi:hypothetical protein
MAVPLRCTQILLRFTTQNYAMRQPLVDITGWAEEKDPPRKNYKEKEIVKGIN